MTKTKFTINRRHWYRGKPGASLWREEKRAGCCLGHVCKQLLDCNWKDLNNVSLPWDLSRKGELPAQFASGTEIDNLGGTIPTLASHAVKINDDPSMPNEVREQKLIALFKEYDYELEFYN